MDDAGSITAGGGAQLVFVAFTEAKATQPKRIPSA